MKSSYDYTKDNRYKSYEKFVYDSLLKLGFRITNVGTMYLKDIILFTYFNDYYEIVVTKIVKDYMSLKKLNNNSPRTFINCIEYSIKNCDHDSFNTNCQMILGISKENIYLSSKNIIILLINNIIKN